MTFKSSSKKREEGMINETTLKHWERREIKRIQILLNEVDYLFLMSFLKI